MAVGSINWEVLVFARIFTGFESRGRHSIYSLAGLVVFLLPYTTPLRRTTARRNIPIIFFMSGGLKII
jgi:hypothetical protein